VEGFLAGLQVAGIAYAIGSIPTAWLVGRLAAGVDVRIAGEGNVGARNVFHVVGRGWGAVVLAADIGKGIAAVLLFGGGPLWRLAVGGAFVVIGHAYPVWLGFVGGKGLAAAGGFLIALAPVAAAVGVLVAGLTWLVRGRFLPTAVAAIVVTFVAAPVTGTPWDELVVAFGLFLLVAVKRVTDEQRMREVEARTGWDRVRGGSRRP
jgi:glycerol-3-phosphate acyltransferase PlsY